MFEDPERCMYCDTKIYPNNKSSYRGICKDCLKKEKENV